MTWLIVANTNLCKIYDYKKKNRLTLVHEVTHKESKLKDSELVSDKPGHYQTDWGRGSFVPREEPKEVEVEQFARMIAKDLGKAKASNQFQDLIFAIPPHMNGLITKFIDEQVKKTITHSIVKDYTHLKDDEILSSLNNDIA